MSRIEIANNISKSNMDIYLKKAELEKIKEEIRGQKFVNTGMLIVCLIFGILILPLFLAIFCASNITACKNELKEIDSIIYSLDYV